MKWLIALILWLILLPIVYLTHPPEGTLIVMGLSGIILLVRYLRRQR